jgi:hypothetical protein
MRVEAPYVSIKSKIVGIVIAILAAFLAGFIPQFLQNSELRLQLENARDAVDATRRQAALDRTRAMAGRILLEASRQNYGTAQEESAKFFNSLRDLAGASDEGELKTSLREILSQRDTITGRLAMGDAAVVAELRKLAEQTYDLPDAAPR